MRETRKSNVLLSAVFVLAIACTALAEEEAAAKEDAKNRNGKFLSVFQIVTFPNSACDGGKRNGTCLSSSECSSKGGLNAGTTCAGGYGVCCTFTLSCGGTSSQNCTYIESSTTVTTGGTATVPAGSCRHTICPVSQNICQLRLDFNKFVISGPSTSTVSQTKLLNGVPTGTVANGISASFASQCLTDTFSVSNSGGSNPAPICGTNDGQHMYVDMNRAGSTCNNLDFQLGGTGIGTTIAARQWVIKVIQLACDSPVLAPSGCTQYFFNPADTVQTYNFDAGQHLANQKQTICVRRLKGMCRICWAAAKAQDFSVSGIVTKAATVSAGIGLTKSKFCCGAGTGGTAGKNINGYDCLQIPGAQKVTPAVPNSMLPASRFCGRVGLVTKTTNKAGALKSICSNVTPFYIRFLSDGYEVTAAAGIASEIAQPNKGFKLSYTQSDNLCS